MSRPPEQKKPEEIDVNVTRTEIPILIEPGVFRTQLAITFWSNTIPPTTIFMWKDEWTPEKEAQAIAQEIKKLKEQRTGTTRVRL